MRRRFFLLLLKKESWLQLRVKSGKEESKKYTKDLEEREREKEKSLSVTCHMWVQARVSS